MLSTVNYNAFNTPQQMFFVDNHVDLNKNNCSTAVGLYNTYRAFALGLLPVVSTDVSYRVYRNSGPVIVAGYGIHEKFVHMGCSVLDISVGPLNFPWQSADAFAACKTSAEALNALSIIETDPVVAGRMRAVANFVNALPPYTKLYYYAAPGGMKIATVVDELNEVKLSLVLSWKLFS